jgi:hypothetical protein
MSEHLSVQGIDGSELPGALQRLDDTQLDGTIQRLDSNQIPRVLLDIKSMNNEQAQRIVQRLDPSKDNRVRDFGMFASPLHIRLIPCVFMSSNMVNNQEESCFGHQHRVRPRKERISHVL